MKDFDFSKLLKKHLRKSTGAHNNCPVVIVAGIMSPKLVGNKGYYTNKSGDIILHPQAYRKAWGKPIYHASSLRIEVGSDWLLNKFTIQNLRLNKLKAFL